ncbi:D-glycero-alpha-D-manno-heptose 7-phosphate kinase [Lachnospiraceae bacterium]|nr:D-glycero-alpha-D-manno-heptose 7-phosphate kinase [Lachnospiraceae bacterium]
MIIARSPLRITLGGGGTDLASYYEKREGFLISAAIDKYVYILINKTFDHSLVLKYSRMERVSRASQLQHPIVREALQMLQLEEKPLEICSMADIPAGTGLGSSSSFTTALLNALHGYKNDIVGSRQLAEEACEIEIRRLGEPIGKQDQYISAYGGIVCMNINKDGNVQIEPLMLTQKTMYNLEDNLILFFTGYSHLAGNILGEQDRKSRSNDDEMLKNLDYVKQLGMESKAALEKGDLIGFADIMNTHWAYKKKRSNGMSNPQIDEWYEYALKNGAVGGKMIGAGGGGFLMFYAENKVRLREAMYRLGLEEVRFRFEREGTKLL